jgi:hypothetical protein
VTEDFLDELRRMTETAEQFARQKDDEMMIAQADNNRLLRDKALISYARALTRYRTLREVWMAATGSEWVKA